MISKKYFIFFYLLFLIMLPSCIKYYEMSNDEFPQAIEKKDDYTELIQENLKSTRAYVQFATKATFDTLWMSDEMKVAFENVHCNKKGKDENTKDALIRRQLEESKHWISFYVLADVRGKNNTSMTEKDSLWSMYLQVGDKKVSPISIKEVELEPEIQFFFGSRFSNFKSPYLVKFPATDMVGNFYLKEAIGMTLFFSSPNLETKVSWSNEENDKAMKKLEREGWIGEEDRYWS